MFLIDLNEIIWGIRNSVLTPMPFLKDFYPMKGVVTNAETKMKTLRSFYLKTIKEHQARDCSRFFVQVGHETKYASKYVVKISKHFFTISCHHQTFPNLLKEPTKIGLIFRKSFIK